MHQDVDTELLNTPGWRGDIERFMSRPFIQHMLITLIIVNAAILGIETALEIMASIGHELILLDHAIL